MGRVYSPVSVTLPASSYLIQPATRPRAIYRGAGFTPHMFTLQPLDRVGGRPPSAGDTVASPVAGMVIPGSYEGAARPRPGSRRATASPAQAAPVAGAEETKDRRKL